MTVFVMIIIHDYRIPRAYLEGIAALFPDVTLHALDTRPAEVYESISCHPDIYFCQLGGDILVHAPSAPKEILTALKRSGTELMKGLKDPRGVYPDTARYNAARVGRVVFHNLNCSDAVIKGFCMARELEFVHVQQGYAACSIVPIGDNALITSDGGIAGAAKERGLDVLRVSAGAVSLPGEKYGFLGGASGALPDGGVVFLGDIRKHPDHAKISGFAKKHGIELYHQEGLPLYDGGRLLIFGDNNARRSPIHSLTHASTYTL
jgi:hypothetical protein